MSNKRTRFAILCLCFSLLIIWGHIYREHIKPQQKTQLRASRGALDALLGHLHRALKQGRFMPNYTAM